MKRAGMTLTLLSVLGLHCGGTPSSTDGAGAAANDKSSAAPASSAGTCGADDDLDDQGADTNCDGADGVVGRDVYVNADLGSDTSEGTPTAPFRTIAAAVVLAATRGGRVVAFAGRYPVERLDAAGKWAVHGGYRDNFTGPPKREQTVLVAGDGGVFLDVASEITLAHLTVQSAAATDPKRPTSHGLRSTVGNVILDDVVIQSGSGIPGPAGAPGDAGADGATWGRALVCNGVTQPSYTSGTFGVSAEGKAHGEYASKQRAFPGTDGAPGGDGADAVGRATIDAGLVVEDAGHPGASDGKPGFGAAGGGDAPTAQDHPWGGEGGPGGCPGTGGQGGVSGGVSVAILVLAGVIDVRRSHLQTGIGGDGGDGGAGGAGGHGGAGGPPMTLGGPKFAGVCILPTDDPMGANCSVWGGIGGSGGVGGHGGGGAGGSTFGIVTAHGASANIDAATTIAMGAPGAGGVGNGGGRAPSGKAIPIVAVQ